MSDLNGLPKSISRANSIDYAITNEQLQSELFHLATKGRALPHPTSQNFDAVKWNNALAALPEPSSRDRNLHAAAVFLGERMSLLRNQVDTWMTAPFSRQSGTVAIAAACNEIFQTLNNKLRRRQKNLVRRQEGIHVEAMARITVRNIAGQELSADDHITHLMDSVPHWMYHVWSINGPARSSPSFSILETAKLAILLASVERAIRDAWHLILWEGANIKYEGKQVIISPGNVELSCKWFAWNLRNMANSQAELIMDATMYSIDQKSLRPIVPVNSRTVSNIERNNGRKRRFIVTKASATGIVQRLQVSQMEMISRLYTSIFLDVALAKFKSNVSIRDICHVWWLLADMARLLIENPGVVTTNSHVARYSLRVTDEELEALLIDVMNWDREKSIEIIEFLTVKPENSSKLFSEGFWSSPLLPGLNGSKYLIVAPLLVGNLIRSVEAWLERGGISGNRRIFSKGREFERHVRQSIELSLNNSETVSDYQVFMKDFSRGPQGEEIDLIFRVGLTLFIGEIKCFLAPSESMERYNYLNALIAAANQARRKADWVSNNMNEVLVKTGMLQDKSQEIRVTPLVVLNQGFGFGANIESVPVTDLHFLSLILKYNQYMGHVMMGKGFMRNRPVKIYQTQRDIEMNIAQIITTAIPLARFDSNIKITRQPFPISGNETIWIEMPTMFDLPPEFIE